MVPVQALTLESSRILGSKTIVKVKAIVVECLVLSASFLIRQEVLLKIRYSPLSCSKSTRHEQPAELKPPHGNFLVWV